MTDLREQLVDVLASAPSYYSRREAIEIVDAVLPTIAALPARLLTLAREERDEARGEYELLRDAVIEQLNPADDDAGEPSIMVAAIEYAARALEAAPCACPPDAGPPEWESIPCVRCQALGRALDVRVDR